MIERLRNPEGTAGCIICQRADTPYNSRNLGGDASEQDCERCGRFRVTGTAFEVIRHTDDMRARTGLSRHVRRNNDLFNTVPQITSEDVRAIQSARQPSIEERAETLFAYLMANTSKLGEGHPLTAPGLDGAAGTLIAEPNPEQCGDETEWLLEMLEERGWLRDQDGDYEVTPLGYAEWERGAQERIGQRLGFIAMAFGQIQSPLVQRGASRAITEAGYEPFVVSDEEHIGRIDDLIVSRLRSARFLVADLTHHRQNVYWEAGFCFGLNTPVFLSCHQDFVQQIHFDIRQYNAVVWTSAEDLAARLGTRLVAVLGRGPIR